MYQSEALAKDAASGHVLLRFQFGEVDGRGEHQQIGHGGQPLQETHGHLHRKPLRRFHDIQFALQNRTDKSAVLKQMKHIFKIR